ncbi:Protein DEHYDRATION-INDUCED 19 homolog 3 [Striga hermonthica]|uniref:Protein DEHYDRATION-INDUCED 19 homolog 3 n=2 Tax=Striga hermonthica TaxID=68872 RepID=A0A9N7RNN6_STRHE|nr:Protein DEHYDRATION-INDUCED 19 homolog 3 [Striga hermonthica]
MDANSWAARLSSASKRYQSALQSRSGTRWDSIDVEMLMGFEEIDMDDDIREEYPCPFCSDYFDIVGLCCHIDDEHPVEAKNGVCPICSMRVGVDMVAHITLQHGNIFKISFFLSQKSRKAGAHSTLSFLRRELREGNFQSLLGGPSSSIGSSNNAAADPLLSSFILPMAEDYETVPSHTSAEATLTKKSVKNGIPERTIEEPPMSVEDKEEKAKRSDFVQGLVSSMMMLDENL